MQKIQRHSFVYLKNLLQKINKHLHSFHALQAPLKMDRIDYTFKFSTELVVLVLSLIIVVANAAGFKNLQKTDSSNMFARELSYHPYVNQKLYNNDTAVNTVVSPSSGFIATASAQVVLTSLNTDPASSDSSINPPQSIINNNAIDPEQQDNIRGLVANQIQNYTVQSGDTIEGLSKKFGISQNTIIWANDLGSKTLKPGMVLTILPINGVLHKVGPQDTLGDIAKAFHADVNQIISYNGLADESDINPGDLLIIPDGVVPAPAKPNTPPPASVKHVVKGKTVYEPRVNLTPDDGHIFPWGQCTYYVAFRRSALGKPVTWGGNAKSWLANARAQGVPTGSTPVPGAIVVTNDSRRYGHVAIVESVNGDGSIVVSEMNYKGLGVIDQRTISGDSRSVKGYIY